jgi:hypothetical protein
MSVGIGFLLFANCLGEVYILRRLFDNLTLLRKKGNKYQKLGRGEEYLMACI